MRLNYDAILTAMVALLLLGLVVSTCGCAAATHGSAVADYIPPSDYFVCEAQADGARMRLAADGWLLENADADLVQTDWRDVTDINRQIRDFKAQRGVHTALWRVTVVQETDEVVRWRLDIRMFHRKDGMPTMIHGGYLRLPAGAAAGDPYATESLNRLRSAVCGTRLEDGYFEPPPFK